VVQKIVIHVLGLKKNIYVIKTFNLVVKYDFVNMSMMYALIF